MQVDTADLQMGTGDNPDNPNPRLDNARSDNAVANNGNGSDDEYESWEGFETSTHLFYCLSALLISQF